MHELAENYKQNQCNKLKRREREIQRERERGRIGKRRRRYWKNQWWVRWILKKSSNAGNNKENGGFQLSSFFSLWNLVLVLMKKDCEILWWKNSFKDEMHELPLTHSLSLSTSVQSRKREREYSWHFSKLYSKNVNVLGKIKDPMQWCQSVWAGCFV